MARKPRKPKIFRKDPLKGLDPDLLLLYNALEEKYLFETSRTINHLVESHNDLFDKVHQLVNVLNRNNTSVKKINGLEKDLEELYDVITFVIEIENEFPEYADEVYENLGWDFHFKKSFLTIFWSTQKVV